MKPDYSSIYTLRWCWKLAILWMCSLPTMLYAFDMQPVNCSDFINEAPPRVSCGFVSAPLDHAKPTGLTVQLPVLIAHSTRSMSAPSRSAILIPGAGGPGAAMGFGYQYSPGEYLQPYNKLRRAGFDIVLVDQRGAGLSAPLLNCVETIEAFKTLIVRERSAEQEIAHYKKATADCRARLSNTDLSKFDTAQSAQDFLQLMAGLDYEHWGVIATSYATVIAQAMLLQNPEAFERVVLDSPVPLDYQKPLTSESTYAAIVKSISRCKETKRCHRRYPQLLSQFQNLISQAARKPYKLTLKVVDDNYHSISPKIVIDEHTLIEIFANAIYSNDSIAQLPAVINSVHNGRLDMLRSFAEDYWYQSTDSTFADALNLTVHCKERQSLEQRYKHRHPEFVKSLSADSLKIVRAQQDICDLWATEPDTNLIPIKPFTPETLIIAGSLDPVISLQDIANTVDDFSKHIQAIVPGAGHAVWFQSQCTRDAVVNFFDGYKPTGMQTCQSQVPKFK